MEIVALGDTLGVEVRGVDLHRELAADQVATLRRAFDQHHLLLFRSDIVSGDEQVRLCRHFGPIAPERSGEFGYISNRRPEGALREGALAFHSDFAFTTEPVHTLSLHALEVPGRRRTDGVRRRSSAYSSGCRTTCAHVSNRGRS